MNQCQIVIINTSPTRKQFLEEQFQKLKLREIVDIHYIRPATIENSKDYLPKDKYLDKLSVICCARSHLYCLEYACLTSSPEFTIVLEDDVVFHKTQFVNAVEEIIEHWDSMISPTKMVSLGWVPIRDRQWYEDLKIAHRLKCLVGGKIVKNIINSGAQAYIVKKSEIQPIIKKLIYPTFEQLYDYIEQYKQQYNKQYINAFAADNLLFEYFGQAIVYPPLMIERNMSSTLEHDNWNEYWHKFYKGYEKQLDDYYNKID